MSEEIKIIDGTYKKDDPHKDIGKQKFRVRKHYTAWVEIRSCRQVKRRGRRCRFRTRWHRENRMARRLSW